MSVAHGFAVASFGFDVLGYSFEGVGAAVALVVMLVASLFGGYVLLQWLKAMLIRFVLRHTVWAAVSATGISIGALLPSDWKAWIGKGIGWLIGLL